MAMKSSEKVKFKILLSAIIIILFFQLNNVFAHHENLQPKQQVMPNEQEINNDMNQKDGQKGLWITLISALFFIMIIWWFVKSNKKNVLKND